MINTLYLDEKIAERVYSDQSVLVEKLYRRMKRLNLNDGSRISFVTRIGDARAVYCDVGVSNCEFMILDVVDFNKDVCIRISTIFHDNKDISGVRTRKPIVIITTTRDNINKAKELVELYNTDGYRYASSIYNVILESLKILNLQESYFVSDRTEAENKIASELYMNDKNRLNIQISIADGMNEDVSNSLNQSLNIVGSKYDLRTFNDNPLAVQINFSKKEWLYVTKYAKDTYNLYNDFQIPIDMEHILANQRYGDVLNIDLFYNDTKYNFKSNIEIEDDHMVIRLKHIVDGIVFIISTYAIISNEFTLRSNIIGFRTEAVVDKKFGFISPSDDTNTIFPDIFQDTDAMIKISTDVIALLLIISDRPEKYTLITESKEVVGKKNHDNKSKKSVKKEYIPIRHILKTKSSAKKYINDMNVSNGERAPSIYTIPEWDRIGHWRTYKDGHKTFIPETTCVRHKNVSEDKTIHIKL